MKKQVIKREITTKHTRTRIQRKPLLEKENIVKEDKKKLQTIENSEEKINKKNSRKEKNVVSKPTPVVEEIIDNNNIEEIIENHE